MQLEKLEAHQQKRMEKLAKAEAKADPANSWWCDCAGGECLRPMQGTYDKQSYYTDGGEYMCCVACFEADLTDDQRDELSLIEL